MLYFMHIFQQELQPHIKKCSSDIQVFDVNGILMIEDIEQYDDSYICLAGSNIASDIIRMRLKGCLFTAGFDDELLALECPEELNLIITDLSLVSLSNHINRILAHTSAIHNQLLISSPYRISNLLKNAHRISEGSFAILDSNASFLYDCIRPVDSDFYISLVKEHQMHELIFRLFSTSQLPEIPMLVKTDERIIIFVPFIKNTNNYLLCTADCDNMSICQTAMSLSELCDPLLSNRISSSPNKNMSFQLFFSRLMSENGDSDDSLMIMLHSLANPPMKNMRLILIRSELCPEGSASVLLEHILSPLSSCFKGFNIAITPTEIIVLVSSDTMYCPIPVEMRSFEKVLEENRAIAVVSNPFTSIMSMRVTCRQCQRIFPIAMAVKLEGESRCMFFSRYTHYNVIDICTQTIASVLGGSDIVILTHPGVVNLTRYDRANGTNLRDTMFFYLMNDRSIAKTSSQMFIHRNTLIYKIKKIEEIIGESMDNPYLRHNLIFSCLLLRYRELYQKEEVSLSRFDVSSARRRSKKKDENNS